MLRLLDAASDLMLKPARGVPRMRLEEPAIDVMTDLRRSPVVTVAADVQIDRAIEHMIAAGVRLCFVCDAVGAVVGTITSFDIQGEKPMRYLQTVAPGGASRRDVLVRHVMQPIEGLKVADFADLERVVVADVIAALKNLGARHLIVVEQAQDEAGRARQVLRGIFSATRIELETGFALDAVPGASTFADIERAVQHPE